MNNQAPKIVTKEQIEEVTRSASFQDVLIQGISTGFVAFYQGNFFAAPIQTLGAPPMAPFAQDDGDYAAQTCVKSGYFRNNPYYVVKVASGGHPWKENSGLMQVYSQSTGRLEALLLDEGILTELRTAAIGSLGVKLLAPVAYVESIGIVGTGVQARYQLQMLQNVVSCRSLKVYGRSNGKRDNFCKEMQQHGWAVECVDEPDELLKSCQVVLTTTTARSPVLGNSEIFQNLSSESDDHFVKVMSSTLKCRLIVCIGADAPGKGELSDSLIQLASLRVADNPEQSLERGEFQRLTGEPSRSSLCPLGKLIQEDASHRNVSDDNRLVILDSSGVALQDCVVSQIVVEALKRKTD